MIKKMMALLLVIGIALMLMYPATALKITKKEKLLPYDKDETISIEVYVKAEKEEEAGKYKLEIEDDDRFTWVDDNDDSDTIKNGEDRLLSVEATANDPGDGSYIFTYHIYHVVNETETEVGNGTFEVEIGQGDSSCGMVFFAIPLVGLIALVALVRRK